VKRTPVNAVHHKLGAKMVEFFGWEMPVQYTSVIREHMAVREAAGLFDVSHMGEIEVRGADALPYLQKITSNDVAALGPGRVQYSSLPTPEGTVVDDLLVYFLSENHYLLCVNASRVDEDYPWMLRHRAGNVQVDNVSDRYCQLAVQGPCAQEILQKITPVDLKGMEYYHHARGKVAGVESLISRTGYTGEDGFEVYFEPASGEKVWNAIMESGRPLGLLPCGLGARDTLRLEACFALYGNDIDTTTTLMEAGLAWIVKLKKGDFLGRDVLAAQKEKGVKRKLVAFKMAGKGAVARHGYPVYIGEQEVGTVTSGSYSPFLQINIGMAYLPAEYCSNGTEFDVEIRGKRVKAMVVQKPFYKR
jgi:aminomethyltransferase